MNVKKSVLCLSLLCSSLSSYAEKVDTPLWLRYPNISPAGDQIAFSYKGDIYKVASGGGDAVRLTWDGSYERMPVWSPDGRHIAFVSDKDRLGMNIYIMDADGSNLRRLTTHSGRETPYSFTPDGKYILFKAHLQDEASSALHPKAAFGEIYRVSVEGGRPELVMGMPGESVQISPDGKKMIFQTFKSTENEWRKHHTSSASKDLMEYDLERKSYRYVVRRPGEDRNPIYAPGGKEIYFLSERDGGTMNVYRSDLSGGDATRLTNFTGEPVRFLSSSVAGKLCFGYAGEIYTLAPNGAPTRIPIRIASDGESNQLVKLNLDKGGYSTVVSPDGKQIALTYRGEIFASTADYSTTKRLTETPGEEKWLTFASDGRSIAYASRQGGIWELYQSKIRRQEDPNFANSTLVDRELLLPHIKGEKTSPKYSPDGKEIAFVLDRSQLVIYNFASRSLRKIADNDDVMNAMDIAFEWSPDGKWLALSYVARSRAPYTDIGIVSSKGGGKIINLTNSGYIDTRPRWAMGGEVLIYRTNRYGMRNHASWGSEQDVMAIFLTRSAYERYQMSKEELAYHEEAEKKAKKEDKKPGSEEGKKGSAPTASRGKSIAFDMDGIEDRIVRLTPSSSALADAIISPDGSKLYYLVADVANKYDLWSYDLRAKTSKHLKKLSSSSAYLSSDKEGKSLFVFGSAPHKLDPKTDALTAMSFGTSFKLDQEGEREAMFAEVEREEGLRFYRKDMHGVDWKALTQYYRRYLPHINNNYDFSEMLSEMLGELNVSHTGSSYFSPPAEEPTAELGLFFSLRDRRDGLLVDEVVAGGPFDKSWSKLRSGDRIIAIDGVEIKAGMDYYPLLAGKANKPLLVSYQPKGGGSRVEEVIKPISASKLKTLLERRWVKQRAALVDSLSNGRLGYVHIPSMGDPSFRTVYSEVLGRYYDREGIVIDIRHNGGGRLHEDIEVFFTGKKYLQQEVRGRDYCEMPSRRWNHPSVMLVCEDDYSNAHGTPWVYQQMKIGKVVGMPVPGTMTSVNWVRLQDASLNFGIPAVGYRTKDGGYLENAQLEPDVVEDFDYNAAEKGRDTQLEKAVEVLLEEVKRAKTK